MRDLTKYRLDSAKERLEVSNEAVKNFLEETNGNC